MFLEDELEYTRLKRNENIMGWLAIVFVAALVFMFAGIMNSASATDTSSGLQTLNTAAHSQQPTASSASFRQDHDKPMFVSMTATSAADQTMDLASSIHAADGRTLAVTSPRDNAVITGSLSAKLADHDIKTGALLVSFALIGGSFVMLTFGGPRGGRREEEDMIDAV